MLPHRITKTGGRSILKPNRHNLISRYVENVPERTQFTVNIHIIKHDVQCHSSILLCCLWFRLFPALYDFLQDKTHSHTWVSSNDIFFKSNYSAWSYYATVLVSCKQVFPHPPVIAYKRNASLRDLLVHSELPQNKPSNQQPAGIHKCNHPRCLTCPFLQEGQTNYIFFNTNETRKITDFISCNSKNLIYLIQCKKCHSQYIGETKRKLNERFGEHRRSILNHHQLLNPTPVSLHFNQPGHSINDVQLILLELIRSKRDSVRKAREAHLISKAKTLHPLGINRRDETRQ